MVIMSQMYSACFQQFQSDPVTLLLLVSLSFIFTVLSLMVNICKCGQSGIKIHL